MKLHHSAYKITLGSSHLLQEWCEHMGAHLVWEGHDQGREIAMEFPNTYRIQFTEIDESPKDSKNKQEAHLAFISDNPGKDIQIIKNWFESKNIQTKLGQWSEREYWIDIPDICIDFVIEVFKPRTNPSEI